MEYLLVFMSLMGSPETSHTGQTYQPHGIVMQRLPTYEACVKAAKTAEAMVPYQEYVTNGKTTGATKSRFKCVNIQVFTPQ